MGLVSMSMYTFLGNLSFALIAISFLVRDILWLRIISIIASVFGIVFNYFAPPTPLWLVIYWNLLFVAINIFHIAVTLLERLSVKFTNDELKLYQGLFFKLDRVDAMKLFKKGVWKSAEKDEVLVHEGQHIQSIFLTCVGTVELKKQGRMIREVNSHDFIGEFYFDNKPSDVTVIASKQSKLLIWLIEDLHRIFKEHPAIQECFEEIMARDFANQIKNDDELIACQQASAS